MKMKSILTISLVLVLIPEISFCSTFREKFNQSEGYLPANYELYRTILILDSIFWDAYNNCNIELQTGFYSDSIEFYHDQAGLITSKEIILEATKENICGKINRELVEGSIEVYPIQGFGAIEIGMHRFVNINAVKETSGIAGKFIFVWQKENEEWKIRRVISLHI
jgi:hypothetical protein